MTKQTTNRYILISIPFTVWNIKTCHTSSGWFNGETMMFAGHACWPRKSPTLYCGIGKPGGGCVTSPNSGTKFVAPLSTGGELSSETPSELGGWKDTLFLLKCICQIIYK